ncbi:MAG: lamin tail domain-containing protein [Myxococcales bacterium]|nr:lamin tail domain-containing protein [Myxococcales bacterium]
MPVVIREIHAAPSKTALNEEWFVVENTGDRAFSTAGCTLGVARGRSARPSQVGTLDPGFTLAPGERVRVHTGVPGKKSQGTIPPEAEGVRNYHLFLGGLIPLTAGVVLVLTLRQHELARATHDPTQPLGVVAE